MWAFHGGGGVSGETDVAFAFLFGHFGGCWCVHHRQVGLPFILDTENSKIQVPGPFEMVAGLYTGRSRLILRKCLFSRLQNNMRIATQRGFAVYGHLRVKLTGWNCCIGCVEVMYRVGPQLINFQATWANNHFGHPCEQH